MDRLREWWDTAALEKVSLSSVYVLFAILMLVVVVVRFIPVPAWHKSKKKNRKSPPAKRDLQKMEERDNYIKERQIISDRIFETLFELNGGVVLDSKTGEKYVLTRDRFKYWMHRLGVSAGLPDLLPKVKRTHPEAIRAAAKRTKDAIIARRKNGVKIEPLPLPEPAPEATKPAEQTNVVSIIPAKAVRRARGAA